MTPVLLEETVICHACGVPYLIARGHDCPRLRCLVAGAVIGIGIVMLALTLLGAPADPLRWLLAQQISGSVICCGIYAIPGIHEDVR